MAISTMCLNPPTKIAYHLCKTCGKKVQLGFELLIVNFVAFTISLLQPTTISLTVTKKGGPRVTNNACATS